MEPLTLPDAKPNLASAPESTLELNEDSVSIKSPTGSIEIAQDSAPESLDLLERIRNGFQFPDFESKYIADYEQWDATHPTYLRNLFARAEPFLFYIVEEIEKRQLPMELALLPAIESAFKPNAKSRSNASGLWQFVPATGRDFGLNEDWWYDGRRDALASTEAALTYLTRLNKMFDGDWFLTLAAYNAGPGTLQRAIKANRKKNRGIEYQDLKLRSETKRYVPKLIALKRIINDPEQYGISLPPVSNQPQFEVLPLTGQIDLHSFADATGIDFNQLMHINAGFKRWASSPTGPHRILVPLGDLPHEKTLQRAKAFLAQAPAIEYRNHKIRTGESLGTIARQYGLSTGALKTANNLHSSHIRAGKNLLIPIRTAVTARPSINTQITSDQNATPAIQSNQSSKPQAEKVVHRVKQGDTLWSIAQYYQVQLRELLTWNNLSTDQILRLDQALLVFRK